MWWRQLVLAFEGQVCVSVSVCVCVFNLGASVCMHTHNICMHSHSHTHTLHAHQHTRTHRLERRNDGFQAVQAGAGAACSASGRASAHGCVCSWCVRHVDVCVDALAALAVPLGVRLRMGVQQHVLLSLTN